MKKTVLLYNFDEKRLPLVKRALFVLKTGVKVVEKKDFGQTIGFLTDVKGYEYTENEPSESFDDEMLVMGGFSGNDIDLLIQSLKKHGVGRIALKAVVTPTNISWNGVQLYNAVKADHESMHGN